MVGEVSGLTFHPYPVGGLFLQGLVLPGFLGSQYALHDEGGGGQCLDSQPNEVRRVDLTAFLYLDLITTLNPTELVHHHTCILDPATQLGSPA